MSSSQEQSQVMSSETGNEFKTRTDPGYEFRSETNQGNEFKTGTEPGNEYMSGIQLVDPCIYISHTYSMHLSYC